MEPTPRFSLTALAGLALAAGLILAGCVAESPFDELNQAKPDGSAFSQALFKNYAFLARSFGVQNAPAGTAFDAEESMSISNVDSAVADVANAFAAKALVAAKGEEPLPEAAPTDNQQAEEQRLRLLRALAQGRTKAPLDAARTQANYDCWILNGGVDELTAAAAQCQRAFLASLGQLERKVNMQAVPAPAQ